MLPAGGVEQRALRPHDRERGLNLATRKACSLRWHWGARGEDEPPDGQPWVEHGGDNSAARVQAGEHQEVRERARNLRNIPQYEPPEQLLSGSLAAEVISDELCGPARERPSTPERLSYLCMCAAEGGSLCRWRWAKDQQKGRPEEGGSTQSRSMRIPSSRLLALLQQQRTVQSAKCAGWLLGVRNTFHASINPGGGEARSPGCTKRSFASAKRAAIMWLDHPAEPASVAV